MSLLQSPQNCCKPCPEPTTTNIPGVQGEQGDAGTDGTNGVNAYTTATSNFSMPAYGGTVTVTVGDTSWMAVGQPVFLGDPAAAAQGMFRVSGITDSTHVVLENLSDGTAYPTNSAPGTVFPVLTQVAPGGWEGPDGQDGTSGAPDDVTYLVQTADAGIPNAVPLDVEVTGLMAILNGTGYNGTIPQTTADQAQAPNDGALTSGDAVFATANGIQTKSDADARTALGLGTMATQDANNVAITGGTITGVSGIGVVGSGVPGDWLVYQNIQVAGNDGGGFTSGSWQTVALNTEVVDTGAIGTLAANAVTLPAGTYRVRWSVPAYKVDEFQSRLINVDLSTVIKAGTCAFSSSVNAYTTSTSEGWYRFTTVADITIGLQARCATTNLTDGFGIGNAFGEPGIFAALEIEKES